MRLGLTHAPMPPDEARRIIKAIYGTARAASAELCRTEAAISRWCSGAAAIDDFTALLLRLLYVLHCSQINWRAAVRHLAVAGTPSAQSEKEGAV